MQSVSTSTVKASKAWLWPAGIIAILALHMLAMGVVAFIATRDPSFAVEPQAYKKAVNWDQSRAQHAASNRLGWTAALEVASTANPLGLRRVTYRVKDERGIAVVAALVGLEAFPHARASEHVRALLNPGANGTYSAELPMRRAGLWEFRITAERGAERFSSIETADVGGGK